MDLGHAVRALVTGVPHLFFGGRSPVRAGIERIASYRLGAREAFPLKVESPAFVLNAPIPVRYTADGEGLAPPLRWSEAPPGTRTLVLLAEDPDAPIPQPFVHWIVLMPPDVRGLGVAQDDHGPSGRTGLSSFLRAEWIGCAPPPGDTVHHYHFQFFALDRELRVGRHPGRSALLKQMKDHVIGFGELVGTYHRPEEP